MKKVIIVAILITALFACKKSADSKTEAPTKYYFKIEAVDNDGGTTTTPYKLITVK